MQEVLGHSKSVCKITGNKHCTKLYDFDIRKAVIIPYFRNKSKKFAKNTMSSWVFGKCKPQFSPSESSIVSLSSITVFLRSSDCKVNNNTHVRLV